MAGDWIKFEHATPEKPEVWKLSEILGCSTNETIGLLVRMWIWFDQQSADGNAGGVTGVTLMKRLDAMLNRQGFARSCQQVGWLTEEGMPHFAYHNGESAKKRALTQKRVKKHRKNDVTQEALPEKRREDIKPVGAKRPRTPNPRWWDTPEGIKAKGREVGLGDGKLGESEQSFKQRIFAKLAELDRERLQA